MLSRRLDKAESIMKQPIEDVLFRDSMRHLCAFSPVVNQFFDFAEQRYFDGTRVIKALH